MDYKTCKNCGKNFKIIQQELNFYKRAGLPIPIFCPNCRHFARLATKNPKQFFTRACAKCNTEIQTTFPPETIAPIYCEECYKKEIN